MSMVMTSGASRATAASASSPFLAVPTTVMAESALNTCSRKSRVLAESSTISTFIMKTPVSSFRLTLNKPFNHFQQVALIEAALDDVGVCPHLDTTLPVFPRIEGSNQHQRQVGEFPGTADLRGQFEAVHPRHVHVRYHQIDRFRPELGQ